ncbi:MAG: cysteine hydrolase family protein [Candidatus Saliniplasma sp.]
MIVMEAVIVIDMIHDFVYGKFGGEGAQSIIDNLKTFLTEIEKHDIPIIFVEDSHSKEDPELDVWGEHAMGVSKGSERISELKNIDGVSIDKNTFDAFYGTELEDILEKNDIDKVFLTGVSTDICVQNTAAGALYRGFDITVIEDCTAAITEEKHSDALEYMKNIFGAEITDSKSVIKILKNKK